MMKTIIIKIEEWKWWRMTFGTLVKLLTELNFAHNTLLIVLCYGLYCMELERWRRCNWGDDNVEDDAVGKN